LGKRVLIIKMKIKADLHNHLSTTGHIPKDFNKIIDKAKERLGPNGIFGLADGEDNRYETFLKLKGYERHDINNAIYIPQKEILVLRGQEVFTKQGHILVLGLNRGMNLKDMKNLEDTLKQAKDYGGVTISTHPCFLDGIVAKNPDKYLKYFEQDLIDAFEVYNGESWLPLPGYTCANKNSQELYNSLKEKYNLGAISSSDGHSVHEIGLSYTWLEKPSYSNAEKLRESLRKSIREHKDYSKDKQTNSLYALDHGFKVGLLKLGVKLSLIHPLH